ncbi:MAG: radical SAM protein [Phycisphaeraceae bacterium]
MVSPSPFTPLKIIRHPEVLAAIAQGRTPAPVTVEVDPTNRCNQNCVWCMYEDFRHQVREELPEPYLDQLMDELATMGVKAVVFSGGGEPLVHRGCLSAIGKAHALGLEVALVTNGQLLNPEAGKVVARCCAWVRISLDAATALTYRVCHRVDGFEEVVANLRALARAKKDQASALTIGAGFLVHPRNYREIYAAAQLAKDCGADYIQFRPVYEPGFALDGQVLHSCQTQLELTQRELESDSFRLYYSLDRFTPRDREYNHCLACRVVGIIAADMKMYICCQLKGDPRFCIGDLKQRSFTETWNDCDAHNACRQVDVARCPPCRYDGSNKILNYLVAQEPANVNFL